MPLETGLLLRFESFLNGFSGTLAGGLLYGIVRHWGNLEGIEVTLAQVLFLAFVFGLFEAWRSSQEIAQPSGMRRPLLVTLAVAIVALLLLEVAGEHYKQSFRVIPSRRISAFSVVR